MKNIKLLILAGLIFSLPVWISAQRGSGGWCTNNNYSRLFDATTITKIEGTIVSVDKIVPENGMSAGLHLMVKTAKETISVHLGPVWFLDNQDLAFNTGEVVIVTGSKVTYEKHPAIIAVEVSLGDHLLILRDRKGFPRWNAWRKGRGTGQRRSAIG
ncbi:MAG: hypothetical protein R2824_07625 [Saprospiraceae bacterium]|nr:hypothetical protein [Lewinella sp.]